MLLGAAVCPRCGRDGGNSKDLKDGCDFCVFPYVDRLDTMAQAQAARYWTRIAPTEPGWYPVCGRGRPEMGYVSESQDGLIVEVVGALWPLQGLDWQWGPRLTFPPLPEPAP